MFFFVGKKNSEAIFADITTVVVSPLAHICAPVDDSGFGDRNGYETKAPFAIKIQKKKKELLSTQKSIKRK